MREEGKFKYLEVGKEDGEVIMLLHGLFGALSNFGGIIEHFQKDYKVVVPMLPIFDLPIRTVSVSTLLTHVEEFVEYKGYEKVSVLGNSLGGHVSILYALANPTKISTIILTGSSGLYESAFGSSFPQRGSYDYIKKKTEDVFFNKEVATKELVDEVYNTIRDRNKAIRVVKTAKSAVRHNLADKLHQITAPTLLIWGEEDSVTPPAAGKRFNELIVNSQLSWISECGHAPMMEKPDEFNQILEKFLDGVFKKA